MNLILLSRSESHPWLSDEPGYETCVYQTDTMSNMSRYVEEFCSRGWMLWIEASDKPEFVVYRKIPVEERKEDIVASDQVALVVHAFNKAFKLAEELKVSVRIQPTSTPVPKSPYAISMHLLEFEEKGKDILRAIDKRVSCSTSVS